MCLPWLVVVWWACERDVTAGLPSFSLCAPVGAYSARWSGGGGEWWAVADGVAPQRKPVVSPGPVAR